ncbi:hypothetical protein LIER_37649 [Lithospermum erythrorhizon]|uniref:DUF4283 domain-containing protein n=1 Tax=Lithospermum erythrorhizon TaxID=34254 RepID=A0AAV3PQE9_LITER
MKKIIRGCLFRFKWTHDFYPGFESPVVPVWIPFPLLPLYWFDKEALFLAASLVGRPLRIDEPTIQRKWLGVARICVEVHVSKELPDEVWLTMFENVTKQPKERINQPLEYQAKPHYCKYCCHLLRE